MKMKNFDKSFQKAMAAVAKAREADPSGDDPERPFYAVRMDETKYVNMDVAKKEIGVKPKKVWCVYITDLARVHAASLTASAELDPVYHYAEFSKNLTEEQREKEFEFYLELDRSSELGYFDWHDIYEIVKKGKNAKKIGEFESYDDAREYVQGNSPF